MGLVEITYYRSEDESNIKSAVVTEMQANDIKILRSQIHIIKINPASVEQTRSYILK